MGYRVINGYTGADVRRYLDYSTTPALRLGAVAWFHRNDLDPPQWVRVPDPMPRIRLVSHAVRSKTPRATLAEIDISTTAIAPGALGLEAGRAGSARFVEDRPGRIGVESETGSRQLLILAEKYLPGWTVRVDGIETQLIQVYGDFMGCVVEAGSHRVDFHFAPESLRLGRLLSLLGLAVSGVLYAGLFVWLRHERCDRAWGGADQSG